MDGFHALGTQGRSHPRQRQDPEEEKLLKSCSNTRLTAKLGCFTETSVLPGRYLKSSLPAATSFRSGMKVEKSPTHRQR